MKVEKDRNSLSDYSSCMWDLRSHTQRPNQTKPKVKNHKNKRQSKTLPLLLTPRFFQQEEEDTNANETVVNEDFQIKEEKKKFCEMRTEYWSSILCSFSVQACRQHTYYLQWQCMSKTSLISPYRGDWERPPVDFESPWETCFESEQN